MNEFSITEGKYINTFRIDYRDRKYDFDEIMQRKGWGVDNWNGDADAKGYPPALEYVVFGTSKEAPEISCEIPEGLEIGFASAKYKEKIRRVFGEFMSEKYSDLWLNANWTVISGGNIKDDKTLNYLANTVGIVEAFAEVGTAVLDPMTCRLFTPEEWREKFFLPIRNRNFDPCAHAVIIIDNPRDKMKRARTLGMRKFGRPDLELITNGEDTHWADSIVLNFANQVMSRQIRGGFVEKGGQIYNPDGFSLFKAVLDENLNDEFFHNMHVTVNLDECFHYVEH